MSSPIQYYSGSAWVDVIPVGNISVSYGIAGIGTSGISTRSLHFETTQDWLSIPERSKIRCTADGFTYYVNSRSANNHIASFDCVDGSALLDQPIDLTNAVPTGQVVPGAKNSYKMDNSFLAASAITSQIYTGCGIVLNSFQAPENYGFRRTTIEGMTYAELLIALSEIHCGFYAMRNFSDTLDFVPLSTVQGTSDYGKDHSFIYYTGTYNLSNVLIQGKEDKSHTPSRNYTLRPDTIFSVSTYNTLEVNNCFSEFADPSEFPTGAILQGWKVDSVAAGTLPPIGNIVRFDESAGNTPYYITAGRVTDVSARLIGSQWLISMGGGLPSGSEIERRSRRQMETDKKITANQTGFDYVVTPYGQGYYKEKEDEQSG